VPTMRGRVVWFLVVSAVVLGCDGTGATGEHGESEATDEQRVEIEALLAEYLPALASTYADGNVERIRPFAVERVMAQVMKRIVDLSDAGLVLEPELESVVIEELHGWGNDFAIVTTFEVWNLRYYAAGGDALVSERVGNRSRVKYQLKVTDGRWRIFHRALEQDLDDEATEQ